MNPEAAAAIKRYEELKLEIKAREAELEELRPMLVQYVPEDTTVHTTYGSLSLNRRTTYTYSLDTQLAEDALKATKAREVQDGTATAKPGGVFIVYKEKKS